MSAPASLTRRSYYQQTEASSWEEIWEAGPYYERLSALLEGAQHHVVLVGWQVDSRLPMRQPAGPAGVPGEVESLKQKILRLCRSRPDLHVYFLMWDHASLYIMEREWWQTRLWEEIHPRVHFVFDNRHPFGASHHEKLCIIDGRVVLCGGIDLCDERWDSPQHLYHDPRRSLDWRKEHHGPYHDIAVQLTGRVCAEILNHVRQRWESLSVIPFPRDPPVSVRAPAPPARQAGTTRAHRVYLSRTFVGDAAHRQQPIVREIEFLFRELIQLAEREVVIEGQYFWSREFNDVLISKLRRMKGREFRLILILSELKESRSFTRNMAAHELRLLAQLQAAAEESGAEFLLGAPYVSSGTPGDPLRSIYVHSKVLLVDDRFISIGSANLATRALRVDTELGVTLEATTAAERQHIRRTRNELLAHWGLETPSGSRGGIFLRQIKPAVELANMREFRWRAPWRPFFDPRVPWLRPIKRRFRKMVGQPATPRRSLVLWAFSAVLSSISFLAFTGLTGGAMPVLAAMVLSSVAVFPFPFFLFTAVLAVLWSGKVAFAVALSAMSGAATLRYVIERGFPASAPAATGSQLSRIQRRLGRRSLRLLLLAMTDPRDGLHRKIVALGQYCIPFPWFLACMMIIFPVLAGVSILIARILILSVTDT